MGLKVRTLSEHRFIELGEVEEESEDLFTFGDDEALSAKVLRASHEPPLVNGRICYSKDVGVDRL